MARFNFVGADLKEASILSLTLQNSTDKDLVMTFPFEKTLYPWNVVIKKEGNIISRPVIPMSCLVNDDQVKAKIMYKHRLVSPGQQITVIFPLLLILDQPLTAGSYEIRFLLDDVINAILPIEIKEE